MNIKSIEELISMKTDLNKKREMLFDFESNNLQSVIKYKKATWQEICKITNMPNSDAALYTIYQNVKQPNLKDDSLVKAFKKDGCEPYTIVSELFTPQEIHDLAELIVGQNDSTDGVKEIKN